MCHLHMEALGVTMCFTFFFPSARETSDIPDSDCSVSLDDSVRMNDDDMKLSP